MPNSKQALDSALLSALMRQYAVPCIISLLVSTTVSMLREIVFGVFLPILLPLFMGLDGLLWSFPAADLLTFVIALFFIRQTYKELS